MASVAHCPLLRTVLWVRSHCRVLTSVCGGFCATAAELCTGTVWPTKLNILFGPSQKKHVDGLRAGAAAGRPAHSVGPHTGRALGGASYPLRGPLLVCRESCPHFLRCRPPHFPTLPVWGVQCSLGAHSREYMLEKEVWLGPGAGLGRMVRAVLVMLAPAGLWGTVRGHRGLPGLELGRKGQK